MVTDLHGADDRRHRLAGPPPLPPLALLLPGSGRRRRFAARGVDLGARAPYGVEVAR
ncbi:hypothetical protein ACFVMA_09675 [Streptomyces rochei]|uniref:hypothetical protein n=1 Tax=Streptomyces rochei TaxID=1928 RepID=UPI0036C27F91